MVTPGLDRFQRNPEALAWLDCAITLGKGLRTQAHLLFPSTCILPRASGHKLLEIGFRLADDEQGIRSALHELM